MLRIGKNANENEHPDKHEGPAQATAPRTLTPSYQGAEAQTKPAPDPAGSSRALTESESPARDIKEEPYGLSAWHSLYCEATFKAMMRIDGRHQSDYVEQGTWVIGTMEGLMRTLRSRWLRFTELSMAILLQRSD
jgi:hypothetical protein